MMATVVHVGPLESKDAAYQALGSWIEANGYRINGPGREVLLQLPDTDASTGASSTTAEAIVEVQFPVEPLGQAGASH
jgi:effector-binding domain-containing protein